MGLSMGSVGVGNPPPPPAACTVWCRMQNQNIKTRRMKFRGQTLTSIGMSGPFNPPLYPCLTNTLVQATLAAWVIVFWYEFVYPTRGIWTGPIVRVSVSWCFLDANPTQL